MHYSIFYVNIQEINASFNLSYISIFKVIVQCCLKFHVSLFPFPQIYLNVKNPELFYQNRDIFLLIFDQSKHVYLTRAFRKNETFVIHMQRRNTIRLSKNLFTCSRILNRKTMISVIRKASPLSAHEYHSSVYRSFMTHSIKKKKPVIVADLIYGPERTWSKQASAIDQSRDNAGSAVRPQVRYLKRNSIRGPR